MDGQKFDRFVKSLAAVAPRRRVLRGLVGTALGALAVGGHRAEAAPNSCASFCADQPGARGAQCRQTCKQCNNDPNRVCTTFGLTGGVQFECCGQGQICGQRCTEDVLNGNGRNPTCCQPSTNPNCPGACAGACGGFC